MVNNQSHHFFQSLLGIGHCTKQCSCVASCLSVVNSCNILQKWIIKTVNWPARVKVQWRNRNIAKNEIRIKHKWSYRKKIVNHGNFVTAAILEILEMQLEEFSDGEIINMILLWKVVTKRIKMSPETVMPEKNLHIVC